MSYQAPQPPLPPMPSVPPLRGKGTLVTGTVLLVLGLIGIVAGIILTANALSSLSDKVGTAENTPTTITRNLDSGTTYAVYAAEGGSVSAGDIEVSGPSGSVSLKDPSVTSSVDVSGTNYSEVVTFDPPKTGDYDVTVSSEGAVVAVAPSLSSAAKGLAWIAGIFVGGLLAFLGVILLLIGAIQRSSSKKKQRAAMGGASA